LRVYNSVSGTILGDQLTRPSAHAHTTCRNGLFVRQLMTYMYKVKVSTAYGEILNAPLPCA